MKLIESTTLEKSFYLANGKILNNINDLINEATRFEDWVFHHHVNEERNDFANWIEHVYKQKRVAQKIKKIKSKKEIAKVLKEEQKKVKKTTKKKK